MSANLTIAIPTYNRNQKLLQNLSYLLPLINDEKIIILDNCSDVPIEDTLVNILDQYSNLDIKIYRSKTNIGLAANFLRCFEYCETEWMWSLSDDDPVFVNCLNIINRDIKQYSDYIFFNYASSMVEKNVAYSLSYRSQNIHTVGLKEFIVKMDSFVNTVFISSGVYNNSKMLPNLRIGYIYSYSIAPHIATLLYSLQEENKVLFSIDKVVNFDPPNPKDSWSRLMYSQAINLLLELPIKLDDITFKTLFNKITAWFMSDEELFNEVNNTYIGSSLKRRHMYLQIISQILMKKRKNNEKIKLLYYVFLMYFPKFNKKLKYSNNQEIKSTLARI